MTHETESTMEEYDFELPVTTQYARARYSGENRIVALLIIISAYRHVIEQKQISHNQSLGVFTVIGTSGNPHAIRIFPRESCTCPSTSRCYHIIAVRMSIGLEDVDSKRKVNLTQLRRNTRSRADKKSGRKAPRPGDYCIEPAPDASILVRYNLAQMPMFIFNFRASLVRRMRLMRLVHCRTLASLLSQQC